MVGGGSARTGNGEVGPRFKSSNDRLAREGTGSGMSCSLMVHVHSHVAVDLHGRFHEDVTAKADPVEPGPGGGLSPLANPTRRPERLPAPGFQLFCHVVGLCASIGEAAKRLEASPLKGAARLGHSMDWGQRRRSPDAISVPVQCSVRRPVSSPTRRSLRLLVPVRRASSGSGYFQGERRGNHRA